MSNSNYAIIAHKLGKRFKRGLHNGQFGLQNQLEEAFRQPFRAMASLLSGHHSNGRGEAEKAYFWALREVSFEIKHGEVVGLIGHNGAGKSVLLKILSQITKPTEGYAEISGSCSSMLEVDSGFHPELTGRENVFMSGAILGMNKQYIKEKYEDIVELSELESFLDTPVKRYSSGMRVRLAFAVAAQLQPDILIMDEILAVGDKSFREKCVHHLKKLRQENQTILIVSHNMQTMAELCSRILWFDHGRLVADGRPEEILPDYSRAKSRLTIEALK